MRFQQFFCAVTLFLASSFPEAHQADPIQGVNYVAVQSSSVKNRNDVIEFFSYACIHCSHFHEPMWDWWNKKGGKKIELQRVHVDFRKKNTILQRLFYTLEILKKNNEFDKKIFDAIHVRRINLNSEELMLKFIEENGIKKEIFIKTYRSDEVSQKVKLANELQEEYRVNNTPSLLIKNKYVTSPNLQLNSRNAQDYVLSLFNFSNNSVEKEMSSIQDTFLVADYLLQTK